MKAAAIQLNSQPDVEKSLGDAYRFVAEAADDGATFICLPENFAFLGREKEKMDHAAEIQQAVDEQLPAWAKELKIFLLGGGYPVLTEGGKMYNRSVLIGPDGTTVAQYDKIHLFDAVVSEDESYRESAHVQGGKPEAVVYESEDLPSIGFSICYDVRFPELYRKLMEEGAVLLTVPAAFTRPTGDAHWKTLLRARAIENSAYVIAPAQTGRHGENRFTYGHSMIINPWGEVLADAGEEPGFITAEIDMDVIEEVRRKLPSVHHRRM